MRRCWVSSPALCSPDALVPFPSLFPVIQVTLSSAFQFSCPLVYCAPHAGFPFRFSDRVCILGSSLVLLQVCLPRSPERSALWWCSWSLLSKNFRQTCRCFWLWLRLAGEGDLCVVVGRVSPESFPVHLVIVTLTSLPVGSDLVLVAHVPLDGAGVPFLHRSHLAFHEGNRDVWSMWILFPRQTVDLSSFLSPWRGRRAEPQS